MDKRRKKVLNHSDGLDDFELLKYFAADSPEDFRVGMNFSEKAIQNINETAKQMSSESDQAYICYWLRLTAYINYTMQGLVDMATGKKTLADFPG
jgi:hypothetical protein